MRLIALLVLLFAQHAYAQKEWSLWPGVPEGVSFESGSPATFSTITNPDWGQYNGGGVAYRHPVTGKLLFIATPRAVYDGQYNIIENEGSMIACDDSRFGIHVVPFPSGENKYYLFHSFPETSLIMANESGLQTRCQVYAHFNRVNGGLRYSILDMDANGGKGKIIQSDQYLMGAIIQRIVLVKHANSRDTWLVGHFWNSNTFAAALINNDGVQPLVFSAVGPTFSGHSSRSSGSMDASPNGKKLAATSGSSSILELYDFDNNTGVVSNFKTATIPGQPNDVCFSPDNSKLYVGAWQTITCGYRTQLYQLDLDEDNLQESLYRIYESGGSESFSPMMMRGLDHKVYVQGLMVSQDTGPNLQAMFALQYPNQPKNASSLKKNAHIVTGYFPFAGYLNNISLQPKEAPITRMDLPKEVSVCFGTYTLSAPAGYAEYRWSNGATTRSIAINEPGLYSVLAGAAGFQKPQAYGYTKVSSSGKALNFGKDTTVCPGSEYKLFIPYTYKNVLWQDGDTSHLHEVKNSGGKQMVTTIDTDGCKTWDSVCVYYKYNPRADFGKDTTLCTGQTLPLRLEPTNLFTLTPATYLWQNGSTKDTFTVTAPGTFWGKVAYDGCTVSDTIKVSYIDAKNISLGQDTMLCAGDSLTLKVDAEGSHFQWSNGAATKEITVKSSGEYWVRINNGSCAVTDTIRVNFVQPPQLDLGADATICQNDSLLLQATVEGAEYRWQDGSTGSSFVAKNAGQYYVDVIQEGCVVSDSLRVSVLALPWLDLGKDTILCTGQSLALNAAGAGIVGYAWEDGSVQPIKTVTAPGQYWVTVTGKNGCRQTDSVSVLFRQLPQFNLGRDTSLCAGQSMQLFVNLPGASYTWSDGSSSNKFTVTQANEYWVQVIKDGCSKADTIVVTYKPVPSVHLGRDTTLCEGSSLLLSVTEGYDEYRWQDGSTQKQFKVAAPGKYHVTASLNGCTAADTIAVNYQYLPRFSLGRDTVLCVGLNLTLAPVVPGAQYQWQDGSTAPQYTVTKPGTYSVQVTNNCGSMQDQIVVGSGLCQLMMPNAFTPNGDGANDLFRVKYPQFIQKFSLSIYNRWGQLVFQTTDPSAGWDGRYKTKMQPNGNYLWTITLTDLEGRTESAKGNVVLLQ
jgi:gliding motility-associated-like protein